MTIRKGSNIIAGNPSLTSVVTLDTPQTITSPKTFTGITMVPTATAGTNDGKAASTEFVNNAISLSPIILPGMVAIWAGTTVPEGYLICDGSAVSRTTYSALFAVIGTTYGVGNGSSTFNLPNFQGRYLKQGTVGTYGSESLPNITGTTIATINQAGLGWTSSGALYGSRTGRGHVPPSSSDYIFNDTINFDASLSSSVYQNNAKVNPDNAEIMYVIKF